MMDGTRIVSLALSIWLIVLAVQDVRRGEASNWLTVPPLLAVTLWRTLSGGWPVGLALALILAGAQWPSFAAPALGLLGLCAWGATPLGLDTALWVWGACYVLWLLGVIGGADAKVVMALVALFPDGRLAWLLLVAWFVLNLAYLVARRGLGAPRSLLRAVSGLAQLRGSEETCVRCPALPAVALAGLAFVWFYL